MSRVNNCDIFNYLICDKLFVIKVSKARWYNFVPAFRKLSKGGTEIVQVCHSCCMPEFCASIVLAFILGVELFDHVVDGWVGGTCGSLVWGRKPNEGYGKW